MDLLYKIKSIFGGSNNGTLPKGKLMGKITHFNYRKGYGFVQSDTIDNKIFLHVSELTGKARKGKRVEFRVEKTDKGIKAKEAKVVTE